MHLQDQLKMDFVSFEDGHWCEHKPFLFWPGIRPLFKCMKQCKDTDLDMQISELDSHKVCECDILKVCRSTKLRSLQNVKSWIQYPVKLNWKYAIRDSLVRYSVQSKSD